MNLGFLYNVMLWCTERVLGYSAMSNDISLKGTLLDPSKCSKLSVAEKRELVYRVSKWPNVAAEALQEWSRMDILQVLCAEMGKERKYTDLTKLKIIEQLLKLISDKKSDVPEAIPDADKQSSLNSRLTKRQRKAENPSRLTVLACHVSGNFSTTETSSIRSCQNSACRATLNLEDKFCKRCSCCICFQFDDNKDPSLWLNCSSDPPYEGNSCGMSCHLECALKDEPSGIATGGLLKGGDGFFCCPSCGKANDLLGCWRKQLLIAVDTRRVDILCYRVALSKKLFKVAGKYQKCLEIVDEAINKLEAEVGPLTGLPVKIGRGIVNRLSTGPEVQKLCSSAVDLLDSMLSSRILNSSLIPVPTPCDENFISLNTLRFENISATSFTLVLCVNELSLNSPIHYSLWHRSAHEVDYAAQATQTLLAPNTRFLITGLNPSTEYTLKILAMDSANKEIGSRVVQMSTTAAADSSNIVVAERSLSPATNCSSLSNPSSVEDESNNVSPCFIKTGNRTDGYHSYDKDNVKMVPDCVVNCSGMSQEVILGDDEDHNTRITSLLPPTDVANDRDKRLQGNHIIELTSTNDGSNVVKSHGTESIPFAGRVEAGLSITPGKLETSREGLGRIERSKSSNKYLENGIVKQLEPQHGSTLKKRGTGRRDDEASAEDAPDRDFGYYVKVIRWLECKGHIEKDFRQKFLTWYGLRATSQEVRIVNAFIDTFIEDPKSLAEQLIDTFSDCISPKTSSAAPVGFCMKLPH